jgi:hypothetical protein
MIQPSLSSERSTPTSRFFEESSERHLTGLEIAVGYLLLQWFAEGFVKGAGEAAGKQAEPKIAGAMAG